MNTFEAKTREVLLSIRGIVNSYNYRYITTHVPRLCDEALSVPSDPIGNAAKMRDALEEILDCCKDHLGYNIAYVEDQALQALATPPRNCDVATEAEAIESLQRTMPTEGLSDDERNIVTACIKDIVGALYAPYEEGGAE